MSLLLKSPEALTTTAAQWEDVGAAVTAANRAVSAATTGPAAAAVDEISTMVAAVFADYGREYQTVSAQAGAVGERLVRTLREGAHSYAATEAASASVLQDAQNALLSLVDVPARAFSTHPLLATESAGAGRAAAEIATTEVVGAAADAINDAGRFIREQIEIYDFRDWRGWTALLLDYTWGLPGTTLGYGLHLANHLTPGAVYDAPLSRLLGFHVYHGGVGLPGFATTLGNVTTHVGTGPTAIDNLVNHEQVHVWQSRVFGPIFQTTYVGWMVGGAVVGTGYWLFHPNENLYSLVETAAYYDNPWEVWAYAYDHNWPPHKANPALLWPAWMNPVLLWPASANRFAPLWRP
ncbi:PE family protein [Mycobacterium camsae]|uniref:PE family protein n=1 Tax=Mycobacterium gordonae TaxID=1778 RepID=UPI0019802CC7|nr:PE family protein [Mycobacterium gordonae]